MPHLALNHRKYTGWPISARKFNIVVVVEDVKKVLFICFKVYKGVYPKIFCYIQGVTKKVMVKLV